MPVELKTHYYVGVDLGQRRDYTAIAVIKDCVWRLEERDPVSYQFRLRRQTSLVGLRRLALGTAYGEVARVVAELSRSEKLNGRCTVCVDSTGVGWPVVEQMRKERMGGELKAVVFTGGAKARCADGHWTVPKSELLQGLQLGFEEGSVLVAKGMKDWPALKEEMLGMRREKRVEGSRWTSLGRHDDLVMAVALAVWGQRRGQWRMEAQGRVV